MKLLDYMENHILYLDGGMGTLLQARGLQPGEEPNSWSVSHPDVLTDIHREYYEAGSNVVSTNTFGSNILTFPDETELRKIIEAGVDNVKRARDAANAPQEKFVALDIGPTGKLLKPYGDLDFEDAVDIFKKTIGIGVACGVDLIFIETMNDSYETKAAVLAAKETCDLPIFVSNAYGADGKLITGANPSAMVAMLEGMGVTALGCNCSLGPKQLGGVVDELLVKSSTPVIFEPNAGLPIVVDGKTQFDVTADEFAAEVAAKVKQGVRIVGGCCGTSPVYIKKVHDLLEGTEPIAIADKGISCVSSYTHTVEFDKKPILIGERLNPTGKKRFKQALMEHDMTYILGEGLHQVECGVQILDVNVGMPELDEPKMLTDVVCELQAVSDVPLQIDTSDAIAMESALRRYNGKAMINSVNGKEEVMNAVFPLVAKYGGFVVCLTLDEKGIPQTAEERVKIANKIIKTAKKYGIDKKDLIFDTLAMTISADTGAANVTLDALDTIRHKLGVHTSLGVSNISFGLPQRDLINGTFFAIALTRGLSAAIMNPYSAEMMKTYYAFKALGNLDENCMEYIEYADKTELTVTVKTESATPPSPQGEKESVSALHTAICKGLKDKAKDETGRLIAEGADPLEIVQKDVIPALDEVGIGFENKRIYLPQLLMSAEAAKEAFDVVKAKMNEVPSEAATSKCNVVIATVKGDVHDIGKNIVRLLLENYGFEVSDLGKDVEPQAIVDEIIRIEAPFCGLSALMTTTVPAMEETIKLIRQQAPWCKVVVGGAVLTQEYADRIGADAYSKDAMGTVRYCSTSD